MGKGARRRALPRAVAVRAAVGPVQPAPAVPRAAAPARLAEDLDVGAALERARRDRDALERRQERLVAAARRDGMAWAEIGRRLGRTGQAVQMRYGGVSSDARCHYEGDREWCEGAAVLARGAVPLCAECASRASTLTKQPARKLRASRA